MTPLSLKLGRASLRVLALTALSILLPFPAPASAAGATSVQYLAEGTTKAGFQEYLTIANTGPATTVGVSYLFADGSAPKVESVNLPATSRTTIDVNQKVGTGKDVSIAVDSTGNQNVRVERPMYFNACVGSGICGQGSHVDAAVAPAPDWYLAEGYTGTGFQEYLTLANPASSTASVTVTYLFSDGSTKSAQLSLSPQSRSTVDVNSVVGPGQDVSVHVQSSIPIVVERPIYFSACIGTGICMNGGDVASGAQPSTTFNLAEGHTGDGFQEYLTLLNPGSSAVAITATFLLGSGGPITKTYTVAASARFTVDVNQVVGSGRDVSIAGNATGPVVAERPLYYAFAPPGTTGVDGGSDGVGLQSATSWYFAEGYTGSGFREYLTIGNPGSSPVTSSITYYFTDGTTQSQQVSVAAQSRSTVDVNAVVGPDRQVSASIQGSGPIVAERPMYFEGCLGSPTVCVDQPAPSLHTAPVPGPAPAPTSASCSASMSNPTPGGGGSETISIASNLANADVTITAHYRTTDHAFKTATDSGGNVRYMFSIGRPTLGYTVVVDVDIAGGAHCSTSFTPQ